MKKSGTKTVLVYGVRANPSVRPTLQAWGWTHLHSWMILISDKSGKSLGKLIMCMKWFVMETWNECAVVQNKPDLLVIDHISSKVVWLSGFDPASASAFFGVALRLSLRVNFLSCAPTAPRLLGTPLRGARLSNALEEGFEVFNPIPLEKQVHQVCHLKHRESQEEANVSPNFRDKIQPYIRILVIRDCD